MKKLLLWALPALLLLCGCGGGLESGDILSIYGTMDNYSAVYLATADFGGVVEYTCAYELGGNSATLSILAPEEVMGVTAVTDESGTKMSYEGTEIITYLPDNWEYAPVGALHGLIIDLKTKTPDTFAADKTAVNVTYEQGDWAKKAILSANGTEIIACEFFYKGDMILNIALQ